MSDSQPAGFAKFVPGFDFLQNLAKNATQAVPQMPNMANWIAPTLNEEELEKRIAELKAVHFWLDQNSKALGATVQALEVQKMTLATLKGMNFNMGDLANAFKLKAVDTVASSVHKVTEQAAATAHSVAEAAGKTEAAVQKISDVVTPAAQSMVDPMQLWTALTQQFQHIAAGAMKEAAKATSLDMGKNLVKAAAKETAKAVAKSAASSPAKKPATKAATKTAATKTAVKKTAVKPSSRSRS